MGGRGLFLTFEGIDGAGKSTQSKRLAAALHARGHDVIHTREPGGSPGAEEIRRLLVEGDPDRWSAETELLLFTAARRDHLEKKIRPALQAGKIVISDRFVDSTRVYQGVTRGDLRKLVDALHALMIGCTPDLTFILDIDPTAASVRRAARKSDKDRFEDFGLRFQERLRAGFRTLVRDHPERCRLIDGNREAGIVAADILSQIEIIL